MKKIVIIDGGPRKNFNTASMLQKFADGANSVSDDENWEKDLQKAYDAGKRMAENILA